MNRMIAFAAFAVLVLLSVSTGITKLMRLPAEMELFAGAGFSEAMTLVFGVVQLAGALLLLPLRTRRIGAAIMVVTFAIASWVVWTSGMTAFFLVSLLFIGLASLPFWLRDLKGAQD